MKKRILTIVLALVMVCSLLPVTAMAAGDHVTSVQVAGTTLTDTGYYNVSALGTKLDAAPAAVEAPNGYVHWNNTGALTLYGVKISGNYDSAIYAANGDLNIVLVGENTVTTTGRYGIQQNVGNLKISGSSTADKLVVQSNNNGIFGFSNALAPVTVTIDTATVEATGLTEVGIVVKMGITINNAVVIATGNNLGLQSGGFGTSTPLTLPITNSRVIAKATGSEMSAIRGVPTFTGYYKWRTSDSGEYTESATSEFTNSTDFNYVEFEPSVAPATIPVTGVTLDTTELELSVGGSGTLVATIAPANATNTAVTWSSSDENVATVTDGVVTAVAAGTATITVTTEDGSKTATCAVTVTAAAPQYKEYAIHSATLSNVQQVLNGVADVTSNDGVITIKLTSNINGRLDFNNHSGKFVLDMNGKTIDAGTTNEALCLNNGFTGTVKVIGSGTFKTGCNNIIYGGGKLTIGLSEGKDYFTLVKDGEPVFVDVNTGTTALSTYERGDELVLTQCNGIIRTITFHANGGTGTMAAASALDGTNYTLPSCAFTAPSGKEFKGWATTANGTVLSGTTLAVTANVDLYAIWEETTQGGGNGGGNQGGNNPTPPAPTYPSYNPPVITTPSVDVDDSTLNDAAGALGSAVLDSKAEIVPAAGYTVEKIAKLQSEGKLNLVIDKKASYDAADKALVDAAAAKKAALCTQYLDIDAVLKTDSGEVVATVKNTVKPLTITIALSAEMQQAAKDGKTLLVVRCHEGKCDYLNGTLNAEKTEITIQSAQFSTYAVIAVGSDAAKTFDGGIALYGAMALLSVGGGAALVIGKKRKD